MICLMPLLMLPWLLLLLLLMPLQVARAAAPSEGPPETWCGVNEVRAPASAPPLAASMPPAAALPSCFACGEPLSYRAFDKTLYVLTRYTGRFTEVLLPASWIDGDGLDDSARRLVLDRADFVYQHASELMGREPAGEGRLQIAFVDATCGYGCGNVGSKGIEAVSSDDARREVRGDLAAGVLPRILVHEMAHNFDLLGHDLWQGAPSSFDYHAWTSFFEQYLEIYTRMGSTTASPDDVQKSWVESTYGAYLRDPEASWERCVAQAACAPEGVSANAAWGGVTHRFAQLHGPHATRRFLAALWRLREEHGSPQSLQDKADLHLEALAEGAGTNLACYADAWRWSISDALRKRLAERPAEMRCIDLDRDGVSPLLGDCNDDDRHVRPGAAEVMNGRDDDCNGLVDDLLVTEPPGGDFASQSLSFPGRAAGTLTQGDTDDFWLEIPAEGDVAFDVCSQGFEGFFFVYDDSSWLGYQHTADGQCSRKSYRLTKGRWRVGFEARNVSKLGAYTVAAGPGSHWPAPSEPVKEPETDVCRVILEAEQAPPSAAGAPDRTRFWISGLGFAAEAPQPKPGRAAFYPEAVAPSVFALRAQPFDAEVPVGDWSAARSVGYAPPADAECGKDPDRDGIVNGNDVCPLVADPAQTDADGDGVGDACDDCITEANGPLAPDAGDAWQRDTDHDGYGNVCDPDLDGNEIVNFGDLAKMKSVFFRPNADADLDGDGIVNFRDLAKLKARFFRAPGPSALSP